MGFLLLFRKNLDRVSKYFSHCGINWVRKQHHNSISRNIFQLATSSHCGNSRNFPPLEKFFVKLIQTHNIDLEWKSQFDGIFPNVICNWFHEYLVFVIQWISSDRKTLSNCNFIFNSVLLKSVESQTCSLPHYLQKVYFCSKNVKTTKNRHCGSNPKENSNLVTQTSS